MKKTYNRLSKLAALLIILIIAFLIKEKALSWLSKKNAIGPFISFQKKDVAEVDITDNVGTITKVYDKGGWWYIKENGVEYRADMEKINNLISAVFAFKKEEVISTNKNKYKDLGVDNQRITLKIKDKIYSLYVGKSYSSEKNYLRLEDDERVFLASGFAEFIYPQDYRDLNIYFVNNENDVTSAALDFDNNKINLDKKDNNWLVNNKKAVRENIDFFLNTLKTLKATDVTDKEALENNYPMLTILIKEKDQEKRAEFFIKDQERYYLKTSNSSFIFEVSSTNVDSLKKEEKDFIQ